ncbi:hypothetical protein T11_17906 [Trichinella zimbabwensis]|uniref:Uncharacterized protein n=1 Tax=Trichinella zimbabwensis TaxID=268475 RepID=A0A0V1H0W3_9BILA|nr:hypothetical protein T11_17906 [Trichinella zimbabwensis]
MDSFGIASTHVVILKFAIYHGLLACAYVNYLKCMEKCELFGLIDQEQSNIPRVETRYIYENDKFLNVIERIVVEMGIVVKRE